MKQKRKNGIISAVWREEKIEVNRNNNCSSYDEY